MKVFLFLTILISFLNHSLSNIGKCLIFNVFKLHYFFLLLISLIKLDLNLFSGTVEINNRHELLLVGSLDGKLHAYNEKKILKWSTSIGDPLTKHIKNLQVSFILKSIIK